ncbi:phosphodiester glycosidase family protein [Paenibacillus algicola]|uniref:phosphodiester glycosidase family protein n=1 Tax=Paenibacillus algicola TaxID=2565926 RepID=UPI003899664B
MQMTPKQVNRLFLLVLAPFIGIGLSIWLLSEPPRLQLDISSYTPQQSLETQTGNVSRGLELASATVDQTIASIERTGQLYRQTTSAMNSIRAQAESQAGLPEYIYNRRITSKLGRPIETVNTERITLELYKVNPGYYQGHALKIKLKDPNAMTMVLGNGQPGKAITTLQAVRNHGAVAGINAGGYADGNGGRHPLSTTFINGSYVTGFQPSFKDLAFVGLNEDGKLIGGKFKSRDELDRLKPKYGATFVPVLMKNGVKTPIPAKWKTDPTRAPRTVIGNYKDDQLLILVTEGYNETGNSGATLQELQRKLEQLGVKDAYNLDGGGSSSLILNGRVVNRPSDGQLRPVPTHFLFFK